MGKDSVKAVNRKYGTQKKTFLSLTGGAVGIILILSFLFAPVGLGVAEALTTDDVQADVAMLVVAGTNQVLFEKIRTKLSSGKHRKDYDFALGLGSRGKRGKFPF